MKDTFYSKRVYFGTYEAIYKFKDFGDTSNYWIALKYHVNRDDYQTVAQNRGDPLNFDLLNEDGEPIFGDIPSSHLNTLRARGYVLGAQHPEPANEEGNLLLVRETYVYAPPTPFVIYGFEQVPIYGLEDNDGKTKSEIVMGKKAGNVYYTDLYYHTILHLRDASKFNVGDHIRIVLNCTYATDGGFGFAVWHYPIQVLSEYSTVEIVAKKGNYIELEECIDSWEVKTASNSGNCSISNSMSFFNCLNGASLPRRDQWHLRPVNGYVLKAHSTRDSDERIRPIRENISYFLNAPTCPKMFVPKLPSGTEVDILTRSTIPTVAQWKRKVERGDWFQYCEAEPTYDEEFGVYELRVRETQCM